MASSALAASGPMPGTVINRLAVSLYCTPRWICWVIYSILLSSVLKSFQRSERSLRKDGGSSLFSSPSSDRVFFACWLLTDRCNAVQLRKEPELMGSVQAYCVPTMRGKAGGLNCTGHRHHRCAGLTNILWRDNEAYVRTSVIERRYKPTYGS